MQETQLQYLGSWEDLEKGMATLCSITAWEIPWTKESGRLLPMGQQRVRHNLVTKKQSSMLVTSKYNYSQFLMCTYHSKYWKYNFSSYYADNNCNSKHDFPSQLLASEPKIIFLDLPSLSPIHFNIFFCPLHSSFTECTHFSPVFKHLHTLLSPLHFMITDYFIFYNNNDLTGANPDGL